MNWRSKNKFQLVPKPRLGISTLFPISFFVGDSWNLAGILISSIPKNRLCSMEQYSLEMPFRPARRSKPFQLISIKKCLFGPNLQFMRTHAWSLCIRVKRCFLHARTSAHMLVAAFSTRVFATHIMSFNYTAWTNKEINVFLDRCEVVK